jgi:hypothetical protein
VSSGTRFPASGERVGEAGGLRGVIKAEAHISRGRTRIERDGATEEFFGVGSVVALKSGGSAQMVGLETAGHEGAKLCIERSRSRYSAGLVMSEGLLKQGLGSGL